MFAPSYFGPKHFAPRYWAPNADDETGGGGSGVGRLEAFSSRVVGQRYPVSFYREPFKAREAVRELESRIDEATLKSAVNALEAVQGEDGPKDAPEATGSPENRPVGEYSAPIGVETDEPSVTPDDLDLIAEYTDLLRAIWIWRQDEEDIAILLLSL